MRLASSKQISSINWSLRTSNWEKTPESNSPITLSLKFKSPTFNPNNSSCFQSCAWIANARMALMSKMISKIWTTFTRAIWLANRSKSSLPNSQLSIRLTLEWEWITVPDIQLSLMVLLTTLKGLKTINSIWLSILNHIVSMRSQMISLTGSIMKTNLIFVVEIKDSIAMPTVVEWISNQMVMIMTF